MFNPVVHNSPGGIAKPPEYMFKGSTTMYPKTSARDMPRSSTVVADDSSVGLQDMTCRALIQFSLYSFLFEASHATVPPRLGCCQERHHKDAFYSNSQRAWSNDLSKARKAG
jgi:hypothetical protein